MARYRVWMLAVVEIETEADNASHARAEAEKALESARKTVCDEATLSGPISGDELSQDLIMTGFEVEEINLEVPDEA